VGHWVLNDGKTITGIWKEGICSGASDVQGNSYTIPFIDLRGKGVPVVAEKISRKKVAIFH